MTRPLALQVAFLTGQSDPAGWALSAAQSAFMTRLGVPLHLCSPLNFPYEPGSQPYRPVRLARASLCNVAMYLRSRTPTFARRYRPSVIGLLERADCTILLAGSCGLELLANLALPAELMQRVRAFSYGPVARRLPACEYLLVQGSTDWLSRRYFATVDHIVSCSHLDYLVDPAVEALCKAFIAHGERAK